MRRLTLTIMLAVSALMLAHPMVQAQDIRTEAVRFPAGSSGALLSGRITGRDSVSYTLAAEAGQVMNVALTSANTSLYFNVYEPGRGPGDEALAVSEIVGPMVPDMNKFSATLPTSGTYTVSVYLYRNAARDGQTADYSLDLSITGATGAVVKGDFADGMAGGPDFWQVATEGGQLIIHDAPSTGAPKLGAVWNGDPLRNLGCRASEGRTWCNVATLADPGIEGWAAAEFLVEGNGMVSDAPANAGTSGTTDALVPGTAFNATGQIPCSMDAFSGNCDFGVVRAGNGNGYVSITLPDGSGATIYFEGGNAASYDLSTGASDAAMGVTRDGDTSFVSIGTMQFTLPDAVINGG